MTKRLLSIDNKRGDFAVLKVSLFALLMTVAANMRAAEPPADSAPLYQMQEATTKVHWASAKIPARGKGERRDQGRTINSNEKRP